MNAAALRIFAHASRRTVLARPARVLLPLVIADEESGEVTTIAAPVPDTVETELTQPIERDEVIALEPSILQTLAAQPRYGETIDSAYRRKERELADLFGALSRAEAMCLERRLTNPREGDVLAERFTRLVVDRRMRLLAILADIPRREACRR
jgi:hypothetical protein